MLVCEFLIRSKHSLSYLCVLYCRNHSAERRHSRSGSGKLEDFRGGGGLTTDGLSFAIFITQKVPSSNLVWDSDYTEIFL